MNVIVEQTKKEKYIANAIFLRKYITILLKFAVDFNLVLIFYCQVEVTICVYFFLIF